MTHAQTLQNIKIQCLCVDGSPWLRGNDVASVLGYNRPRDAIKDHVPDKFKNTLGNLTLESSSGENRLPLASGSGETSTLDHNDKISVFISEAGLYKLVLKSKAKNAEAFSDWVCSEVLPSIRKTGGYVVPTAEPPPPPPAISTIAAFADFKENRSFTMISENDLHTKVVDYVRRFYPQAKMMAGLGEFQKTSALRIEGWQKGYQKGTGDLMIINNHLEFRGFCLEFKNPRGTGSLSDSQDEWLQDLHLNGYKVMVSNDYDAIVKEIAIYFEKVRLACPRCIAKPSYFKTEATLQQHKVSFHRIGN